MVNAVTGGKVFGESHNEGWILGADGSEAEVPQGSKHEVAVAIWNAIEAY